MPDLIYAETEEDYTAAADLFREYAAWLGIDLSFQKFEEELLQLRAMYALPYGGIILYKSDGGYQGCVAVRKNQIDIAELKRMYVKENARHRGIGAALLEEAIRLAVKCGYKKMRLDTLDNMLPAISLYKKNGFVEIPAYYFNPEKNTVYFEKLL